MLLNKGNNSYLLKRGGIITVSFFLISILKMVYILKNGGRLFKFYLIILFLLFVLPLNGKIELSESIWGFRSDHFVHASLFLPFFTLMSIAFLGQKKNYTLFKKLLISNLFCVFFETLHLIIPYRQFSVFDLLANLIGMYIGLILYYGVSYLLKNK